MTAARRAERAGVGIDWIEGDAEALPFDDGAFDTVLSVFGVQFAPRHQFTADELARVCRPGGRIGLVNWTPDGLIGQLFRILGGYMPAAPDFASPPPLWGTADHIRSLFAGTGVEWASPSATTRGASPPRRSSRRSWRPTTAPRSKPVRSSRPTAVGRVPRGDRRARRAPNEARDGSLLINAEYLVASGRKTA